jgi:hypothetical protein
MLGSKFCKFLRQCVSKNERLDNIRGTSKFNVFSTFPNLNGGFSNDVIFILLAEGSILRRKIRPLSVLSTRHQAENIRHDY